MEPAILQAKRTELEGYVSELQSIDEAAGRGELSDDQKARLTELDPVVKGLTAEIRSDAERRGVLRGASEVLAALGWVDPETAARAHGLAEAHTQTKSIGEQVFKSEAFAAWAKTNISGGSVGKSFQALAVGMPGLTVKTLVTSQLAPSGSIVAPDRIPGILDAAPLRPVGILDQVFKTTTGSDTAEFVRVASKTNNAAPVIEGSSTADAGNAPSIPTTTGKPESGMVFEQSTTAVEEIAHWIPVTRRALADVAQMQDLVNQFLLDGLRVALEDQMLTGSGTSPDLRGLLNTPGLLSVTSAGTDLDAVVDAIRTIVTTTNKAVVPTTLVLNPADWFSTGFALAKDANGNYMLSSPMQDILGAGSLWGLRVVVDPAVPANTALVGDFRQAWLFDREQARIELGTPGDFFLRNLVAVLAELRAGFAVVRPQAFCTITGV